MSNGLLKHDHDFPEYPRLSKGKKKNLHFIPLEANNFLIYVKKEVKVHQKDLGHLTISSIGKQFTYRRRNITLFSSTLTNTPFKKQHFIRIFMVQT